MNNIFEGAKFGDKFLTRDGNISLFIKKCHLSNIDLETDYYRFYILNDDETLEYNVFDGGYTLGNDNESPLDIVSKYQEPIDEEKLDNDAKECFKAGYRKAIENAYEWLKDYTQLRDTHFCKDGKWYNKLEVFKQAMEE